jgi:hypothetical protein
MVDNVHFYLGAEYSYRSIAYGSTITSHAPSNMRLKKYRTTPGILAGGKFFKYAGLEFAHHFKRKVHLVTIELSNYTIFRPRYTTGDFLAYLPFNNENINIFASIGGVFGETKVYGAVNNRYFVEKQAQKVVARYGFGAVYSPVASDWNIRCCYRQQASTRLLKRDRSVSIAIFYNVI